MLKSELPDAIINTLVETMKQRDAELAALRAELAAVKADWNNHAVNGLGEIERMRAALAAMTAERDKWRDLVVAHNSALEIKCRSWQSGGYCSAPGRPHACHDCPLDWKIDVPSGDA